MRWLKQGRIFDPASHAGWGSHAQGPTVLVRDDYLRIYFASRPRPNISLPSYIDVDAVDPQRILSIHQSPLLEVGGRGSFDEFGVMPCDIVDNGDEVWLFYTGWSRGTTVTYVLSVGLAVSRDGGASFRKAFEGPVLDRTRYEPFMTMAAFILREGERWHAWYGSGIGFYPSEGKYEPRYVIKYACSLDGMEWHQPNVTCIEPKTEYESNTRPTVIKVNDVYHMWFAYRGAEDYRGGKNSYRIGYARSSDAVKWQREDAASGIAVSDEGWDSTMLAYPYVVRVRDRYLMFYNGDGFGASGFGYAIGYPDEGSLGFP
ncbi:MAG TPA: hypothetical protein VEK55_03180 [Xanthobacteraceae bacterium]|nr:hypothetical protein [Xanthobacteraceae bacterium]